MRRFRRQRTLVRSVVVLCATLAVPPGAAAQTDPLDPGSVEAGLQGWLTGLLGPNATFPPNALTITRDGDHDRITVRTTVIPNGVITTAEPLATANLRRVGTAWQVNDITATSPLRLSFHAPHQSTDLASVTTSFASQSAHASIDPTGQAESVFQGAYRGFDSTLDSQTGHQVQHIDSLTTEAHWRPGPDHRADMTQTTDAAGYKADGTAPDGSQSHVSAARLHVAGHVDSIDPAKVSPALQSMLLISSSLATALPAAGQTKQPGVQAVDMANAVDHAAIDRLLLALPGLIGGLQVEESADTLVLTASGFKSTLAHFGLGMSASAPGGLLQAKFDVAVDGLAVSSLPAAFADLAPRHIAVRPTISGLDLAAVMGQAHQVNTDGTAPNFGDHPIFGPDGLVANLDGFNFDLGPATLSGNLHAVRGNDTTTHAAGTVRMSGYDALFTRVMQSPALKQAAPMLIMAKGLARPDGDDLVWDVSYENGNVTVNGKDLSGMAPPARKR